MIKGIKYIILGMAVYAVIVIPTGLIGGCASQRLPPKLSQKEKVVLNKAYMDISIGVERYSFPAYSDSLRTALSNTGPFREVKYLEAFEKQPDFIATVEDQIYGTSVIPIFTGLTLGLFPTWGEEEWGESFSLRKVGQNGRKIDIEYRYSGTTFLGWLSGILNLISSNRTSESVESHEQFIQAFSYAIALRKAEIIDLTDNDNIR